MCLCGRATEVHQDHQAHPARLVPGFTDQRSPPGLLRLLICARFFNFALWFGSPGFCRSARTTGAPGSTRRGHPGAKGKRQQSRRPPGAHCGLRILPLVLTSQGEPGFLGPTGPRGPPGDSLPGEKVLGRFYGLSSDVCCSRAPTCGHLYRAREEVLELEEEEARKATPENRDHRDKR